MVRHASTRRDARRTGVLLAGGTALVSGVAVFTNGYGVRAWTQISDATTYTTLKNAGAALILFSLLAVVSRRRGGGIDLSQVRGRWPAVALIAVIGGAIPFALFFEGLARATSSDAAFLHKTLVIWVTIMAVAFLKERIGLPHLGAIVLLIWGQAALSGGVGALGFGAGEWMILAATLMWSVETVVAKKVLASVDSLTLGVIRLGGGVILLAIYTVARGGFAQISGLTGEHLLWVGLTALTLAAYVGTWYAALARAQATDVTAVLVGAAIITALLDLGVRGIALPSPTGLGLVMLGVLLVAVAGWRRRPVLAR